MTSSTLYRPSERIAARVIDGAAYVVSVDQQRMVELNEVGTFIWEHLGSGATAEGLAQAVSEEFAVELADARRDVDTFLAELLSRGVVRTDAEETP